MTREEARYYLKSSGFSGEQINAIEQAFNREPKFIAKSDGTIEQIKNCDDCFFKKCDKIGHWITHPKGIYAHLVCDKCLSHAPYDCRTNYCPNCGTKMFEPQEQESEDYGDYPDTIRNQFDNMTGSMNL